MPIFRISTMATRITTTRTTSTEPAPSADYPGAHHADFSLAELTQAYLPPTALFEVANSYFGLLRQATHSHHERAVLANTQRQRGHSVNHKLTKTYRRGA